MRLASNILKVVLICVYSLCGIALVVFLFPATGFTAKDVATGSMRPAIPPGSLVIIHQVPLKSLQNGDVVTYKDLALPGATITHRVVQTKQVNGAPYFVTKGDANTVPDHEIPGGLVLGKVVVHMPVVGRITAWGKTWLGLLILVAIPGALIIIDEIRRLKRALRETTPAESAQATPHRPGNRPTRIIVLFGLLTAVGIGTTHASLKTNTVRLKNNTISVQASSNLHPTTIFDCLFDGYKKYGFKNVGECVVYVVQHQPHPTPPPIPTPKPPVIPTPVIPSPPITHHDATPSPSASATPSPSPSVSPSPIASPLALAK